MNFKRFDPLNEYIRTAYGRCVNNCYSFEQAEIELDNHKTNPIHRAGIGFFMIDIAPNKARGYLAAYDALNALGYDYDSELILKKYISKKGFHILMAVRLINRYIDKSFFDDAINVINLAKNEIYKYLESNASLRLRISSMYKTMCLVHEYEELSCDRDFFRRTEYVELFEKLTASSFQEQNSLIKDLIESENSISATIGFWIALNSGNKTEDFFSIAVKNLITENDSAARLIYFRIRAREEFSDNYSFVDLSIQSFLHRSEIGRAERVISELLSREKYDSNILNHAVRVSALTGFLDSQIISNSDWKGYSQEKSYLLQRQLSIAKWHGDSEKFSRIYSSTKCNNLFEFRGFIHDNFFQRNKKKISVALLVSGQLRGSEQLIKENITLLSKQLNADVFMDVWDEQVLSPPRFNRVVRFLGGELYDRLPEEAKTPVVFQKLLPSVFKKLTTPIKKYVNSEGLMQSYSALTARVED